MKQKVTRLGSKPYFFCLWVVRSRIRIRHDVLPGGHDWRGESWLIDCIFYGDFLFRVRKSYFSFYIVVLLYVMYGFIIHMCIFEIRKVNKMLRMRITPQNHHLYLVHQCRPVLWNMNILYGKWNNQKDGLELESFTWLLMESWMEFKHIKVKFNGTPLFQTVFLCDNLTENKSVKAPL